MGNSCSGSSQDGLEMNILDYIRAGWLSETVFGGVNLEDSPSEAIKGAAREPRNWRRLGTTDVKEALKDSGTKRPVCPKDWAK